MEHTPLKDRPWMPLAMAALGHIIWGFSVLFSKVAMEVAQPDVLLSIRFLLSALLMTLMILFGKAKLSLRGKNLKPLLLLAVTEPMYFYFESYGIPTPRSQAWCWRWRRWWPFCCPCCS